MKIKDEVILKDWIYKIVIPQKLKPTIEKYIPQNLTDKIIYIKNDCRDIWEWSEKVFSSVEKSG
jgi:CO dehydrogenase/acetyl-CoA synthase beta subunit